jgi:hypothetical protein
MFPEARELKLTAVQAFDLTARRNEPTINDLRISPSFSSRGRNQTKRHYAIQPSGTPSPVLLLPELPPSVKAGQAFQ